MRKLLQKIRNAIVIFSLKKGNIRLDSQTSTKQPQKIIWSSCDTLPIKVFYEILETENIKLLGEADSEQLAIVWLEILDKYWQKVDPVKYKQNISKSVNLLKLKNQLTTMVAALTLCEYGQQEGMDVLKVFGYKDIDSALNGVQVVKTKLLLASAQATNEIKKVEFNFYRDLAMMEQVLERSLNHDNITVSYWIELNKLAKQISNGRNKHK